MIKSVEFKNFRVLRDATLPLGRYTLIVGPNGSGKSTALQGLQAVSNLKRYSFNDLKTFGSKANKVEVALSWESKDDRFITKSRWDENGERGQTHYQQEDYDGKKVLQSLTNEHRVEEVIFDNQLANIRLFLFDANRIAEPMQIQPNAELESDGRNLVVVLDSLQDRHPERFTLLNSALGQMLPEFDRILFETIQPGYKAFSLRTRKNQQTIPAQNLSQGTRLALALLTLAYLPTPPSLICLEEPDRGIHPRLLREVQEALYRLSHPEDYGELRDPVQVVATTHSPYLLDLHRDHLEEVVMANRNEDGVYFERLSEQPYIEEILRDSQLGDVWYTGILGGVPAHV